MKKASSDLLLLDVNVLLALAWPNHQFHAAAIAALSSRARWATCALTQLGFIRLSSNPAAIATAKSPIAYLPGFPPGAGLRTVAGCVCEASRPSAGNGRVPA